MLQTLNELGVDKNGILLLHDLFGYLSCNLSVFKPQIPISFASQAYSIEENARYNNLNIQHKGLLDEWDSTKIALVKVPKSLELFRLYLLRICTVLEEDGTVLCGFMTRNFTAGWIKLAEEFFEEVSQTRAHKKARVMVLKRPKPQAEQFIHSFKDENDHLWQQYLGVFSAGRIDYASQFLMENLELPKNTFVGVDVGSGNGVLGKFLHDSSPESIIHLTDDSYLAVESGKLNVNSPQVHHHFSRNLSFLHDESCDIVISNPPFHLEYEINMDVAFQIFKDAFRVLHLKGELWIVANNNLPYKPELLKHFKSCEVKAHNRRFIIYRCIK